MDGRIYIRTHDAKTIPFRLRRGIMNMRNISILHLRHRCEPLISNGSLAYITTLRLLHKSLQICFRRQLYGCRKADVKQASSKCFQYFNRTFVEQECVHNLMLVAIVYADQKCKRPSVASHSLATGQVYHFFPIVGKIYTSNNGISWDVCVCVCVCGGGGLDPLSP